MAAPSRRACLGDISAERERLIELSGTAGLDLATAREYLGTLPPERFASFAYRQARPRPYIQPRGGFPSADKQRALVIALYEAGADFVPLTIDSCTRHNEYDQATALLKLGEAEGHDLLNGYPLVSHGYQVTRRVYRDVPRPASLRHGTPDARLLAEVALASGITEIEGGGLSYTLPYSKRFPLDRALMYWQYVDRLCATSGPDGTPLHRESFGPLTATLVPPVIAIVVQLCELLLAAEQGVESFAVSFGQTGSIEQDIAVASVLRRKSRQMLARFGLPGVNVSLVFHQWMGAFPSEQSLAWQLIAVASAVSALIGADKVVTKTPEEALGIPPMESNAAAVRAVRYVLDMFSEVTAVTNDVIEQETELIDAEVASVMDFIFAQPCSTFLQSVYRSVLAGAIDIPFAPHDQNLGQLIPDRGTGRRIRILDPGAVPLSSAQAQQEQVLASARAPGSGPLWERLLADIRIMA